MNFDEAFKITVGHEGGFTQNPKDAGNWTGGKVGVGINKGTKYGIASNSYPNLDIKNLTLDQAKAIYKRDYWNKAKCDELPNGLRFHVFDVSVNSGVSRGIKTLQQAVGVTADGIIGPKTIAAAKSQNESDILLRFYAFRTEFYTSLSTFPTFGKGWMNRVASNLKIGAR